MTKIHPTAVVSGKAELGENVSVGPYAVIYDDVHIGNDSVIGPHAVIYDGARVGERVKIHQSAAVSNVPQDLKFADEESYFYIGDDTVIREFVTLHRGTVDTGFSKIGKNCLFMAYAHVAHDCIIGDNCIIANGVQIGGHAELGDWVIIGGITPVHQFSKVGAHAMIGGGFRITVDIPPFVLAAHAPLRFVGVNLVGLRRRGFTNEAIMEIKDAYKILYQSGLNTSQAIEELNVKYKDNSDVQSIIKFIEQSSRSVLKA